MRYVSPGRAGNQAATVSRVRRALSSLNPRLPRAGTLLQLGGLMNAFGNGLVLPFLLIYLHNERDRARRGRARARHQRRRELVSGPIAGALVDRVGGELMLTVALGFLAVGFGAYAFVETLAGLLAGAVTEIGNGMAGPAQSTLLTGLTTREQRPATFGMQRVVMNLGIGLGGVAGGFIATESFRALFVLDALTFVAYAFVLNAFVPDPAGASPGPERWQLPHGVPPQGLRGADGVELALHRGRISQLEILPAFAKNEAGVSGAGSAGSSSSTRS